MTPAPGSSLPTISPQASVAACPPGESPRETGFAVPTIVESVDSLSDLVRDCASKKLPIIDYGVAHQGLGNPPPEKHVHLQLRGGVIEHYTRDLAVRVSAGMKLGDLQRELAPANQFLPIEADEDVTIGEIINHQVYGPMRAGFGSIREMLLGLHYVDSGGRDVHVGGRTVKNVAGYDVTRFMVGSLGEFGIIHEATIKTCAIPPPPGVHTTQLNFDNPSDVCETLPGWITTDATPGALELTRIDGAWSGRLTYFGTASGCTAQLAVAATNSGRVRTGRSSTMSAQEYLALGTSFRLRHRGASTRVKIIVPPASTGSACTALAKLNDSLTIHAMPVHGCIFVGGALSIEQTVALDQIILKTIEPLGGFRAWHDRPEGSFDRIAPFAPLPPDWALLLKLKDALDPDRLFNPGRFLPLQCNTS